MGILGALYSAKAQEQQAAYEASRNDHAASCLVAGFYYPQYLPMRRIDPDVVEAVCLLQEKAADRMADWCRDDYMKAAQSVEKYGGRLIDWQSMSLASWLEQTRKSARAAACARKLMGIE